MVIPARWFIERSVFVCLHDFGLKRHFVYEGKR
jgi:hypothetical protein